MPPKRQKIDHQTWTATPPPRPAPLFPEILYEIISDPENFLIISWLPHGKGFSIHDKHRFATEILPRYFEGTQYSSFTRRLKRWNFERVPRGPEMGAYYNKCFQRGEPESVMSMIYGTNKEDEEDGTKDDEQLEEESRNDVLLSKDSEDNDQGSHLTTLKDIQDYRAVGNDHYIQGSRQQQQSRERSSNNKQLQYYQKSPRAFHNFSPGYQQPLSRTQDTLFRSQQWAAHHHHQTLRN
jgi:hypothetical protein